MTRRTIARNTWLALPLRLAVGMALGSALTGCYEEVGAKPAPARTADADADAADDVRSPVPSAPNRGSSVYGKSKGAAKRTLGKVGDRQKELEKEIDDQNN